MKAIDLSKFKKSIEKNIETISVGFSDPKTFISMGNYALNFRVSGDFHKGIGLDGKMTLVAGESGSSKSYLVSGNMVKWCQDNGVLPIVIDTENALDEAWMQKFGIDTKGYIMRINASLIDDIAKVMADFVKDYKVNYKDTPYDDKPKVLFIIDSLGMATTSVEVDQVEKGDIKGDLGRKQKQLFSLCRTFMSSCGNEPIGLIATQHTYASQDLFSQDAKIAGGSSLEYTPSYIIAMTKSKLKEDEDGNKTTDVQGIKVNAVVRKTRYTKPFQKVTFTIPYETGINCYSGLFILFSEDLKYGDKPVLQKEGNQYAYYSFKDGEQVFKKFRKNITNEDYDMLMKDYMEYQESESALTKILEKQKDKKDKKENSGENED